MASQDPTYSSVHTVLGTTRRDSRWHLTDEVDVVTVLGRGRFDLRNVETSETEVVEISMKCILGSVDFVVPDGTMVVLDGTSFLAGARSDVSPEGESPLPRIEVTALTILGRVRILSPDPDDVVEDEDEIHEEISEEISEDSSDIEATFEDFAAEEDPIESGVDDEPMVDDVPAAQEETEAA